MMNTQAAATLLAQNQDRQAISASRSAAASLQPKGIMSTAKIDVVAKDFESMFVAQMLGAMFQDSTLNLFGDEDAQEIYKEMMMDAYGKAIVDSGGIGIAPYVKKELLALQEVKS